MTLIDSNGIRGLKFPELPVGEMRLYEMGWNDAIEAIMENADRIQIVRCGDCKYFKEGNRCDLLENFYTKKDWFCADGEEKEDEAD